MIAEVPETSAASCALFSASGYVQEARLTDYVLDATAQTSRREGTREESALGFVIPVTVDDLVANGLLGTADPKVCWERSIETLAARKDEITGLAIASDERIEAYLLYAEHGAEGTEIMSLGSLIEDGGTRLAQLFAQLRTRGMGPCRIPKVHQEEISTECLENLGFRAAGGHLLYAATARSDQSGR